MKIKQIFVWVLICLGMIIAAPAYGTSIVGDTVTIEWDFPALGDIIFSTNVVVPATVFPDQGVNSVSIGDGVITVDNGTSGWTGSSGFNGFIFTDLTKVPNFTSLSLVSITGFPPPVDPILSFNADQLIINFNANSAGNLASGVGQVYTFSFTAGAAVPEPATLLLLGSGLLGLWGARKKFFKK